MGDMAEHYAAEEMAGHVEDSAAWQYEDAEPGPNGEELTVYHRGVSLPDRLPVNTAMALAQDPYVGVAARPFNQHAQQVLAQFETVPDEWIDIKPNGLIYLSHMKARHILNAAFGYGGWAVVPVGDFRVDDDGKHVTLYRQYRLYVDGRFVGETVASGDYWKNNDEQNYGDAAEACQSYAINRLAKNFGLASQCWDRAYGEEWKRTYAETYTDKNGKLRWKKRTQKATGAAAPATVAHDSQPATRTPEGKTSSDTSSHAPAPVADRPRRTTKESKETLRRTITIATTEKEWKVGDRPCIRVRDAEGVEYSFMGTANVALAKERVGRRVAIEFTQNGKWKNVEKAEPEED